MNSDSALTRFEFLHILVRLAIHKYVFSGRTKDVSTAVDKLMRQVR